MDETDALLRSSTIEKVVNATATLRDKCIVKILAQTGMKRVELHNLDARDVDFERRLIHIRERKLGSRLIPFTSSRLFAGSSDLSINWKPLLHVYEAKRTNPRTIPLSEDLFVDLRHLLGRRRKGPVLTNSRGERLTIRQINNIVSKAGRRAGVKRVTCKALREYFIYEWKNLERSREELARILGQIPEGDR